MEFSFIMWIIVFLLVSGVEALTQQLVAIWFSIGSLVCVFLSYFGVSFPIQLIVFIVISMIAMLLFRPYAMKHINVNVIKTAPENVIGKTAIVTAALKAPEYSGRVKVDGMDWAAISPYQNEFELNDIVIIEAIDGVKLLVKKEK